MARASGKKRISLALQGGGSHGAFTWGVLDRLAEEDKLEISAISATSAGAMNAVAYLSGLRNNGRKGARVALENFWSDISNKGALFRAAPSNPMAQELIGSPFGFWSTNVAKVMTTFFSPYDLNPANINPLRDILKTIDFDAVRSSGVDLHVAATNVQTGQLKDFSGLELTCDAVLASACLPQVFQAVEIDGVPYWDGGYVGNPNLQPLLERKDTRDILLVTLNPIKRTTTPRSAAEIQDRLNEIIFNTSLLNQLRKGDAQDAKPTRRRLFGRPKPSGPLMDAIQGDDVLSFLSLDTKFDTSWQFLTGLRDKGRKAAADWLKKCEDKVGYSSTVDIEEVFFKT